MAVTTDHNDLGERVAQWRELGGISRKELARRAGLSHLTLLHIEQGEGNPTLRTLEKIADVLGVTVAELLEG